MSGAERDAPRAILFGCAGESLSPAEAAFFAETRPLGFILFARNCRAPDQVRALVAALRKAVGRADAPVLIDQEGGRVARLGPPFWRRPPSGAALAALYERDEAAGLEAARTNARLVAADLHDLGVDVDCWPVLDLPAAGSDPIIGDRALGGEVAQIAALGQAICDGLLAGGVLPVVKHCPGHGRATLDSHLALPRVGASRAELETSDFAPFRALREAPFAMTAHVVYEAIDKERAASLSPRLIEEVIRGAIGFEGALISDDIGMAALSGSLGERAQGVLAAGCDLALHCSGRLAEMEEVAAAVPLLGGAAAARVEAALALRREPEPFACAAAQARLDALFGASA